MKENTLIFYFRTGGDVFSLKVKRNLSIFSDSFVVYSANLTGFHVFAFMQVFAQLHSIFFKISFGGLSFYN